MEANAALERVLRIDPAGRERSEVEVGEARRKVTVEDGSRQDILEADEQWGHVGVEKEGRSRSPGVGAEGPGLEVEPAPSRCCGVRWRRGFPYRGLRCGFATNLLQWGTEPEPRGG